MSEVVAINQSIDQPAESDDEFDDEPADPDDLDDWELARDSADMADGSRLSYCEITGIVRRDGATDGTGPHPAAAIHRAPRRRGGHAFVALAACGARAAAVDAGDRIPRRLVARGP